MAEISLPDEVSDDLSTLRPLVVRAARGELTPEEGELLRSGYDAIGRKANEMADARRIGFAIANRGRTRHTTELAQQFLRKTG